jgi:hypothetical protein
VSAKVVPPARTGVRKFAMTRDTTAAHEEFAAWLRRGLGRPAVHWQDATPTDAEREALLHACTHDLRYDAQCENDRAGYLWTLIGLSGDPGRCRDHLLRALARSDACRAIDCVMTFALLRRFAGSGDQSARAALHRFFQGGDPAIVVECDEALIGLDGIDALTLVADRFAGVYAAEAWRIGGLVEALCARDGRDAAMAAIAAAEAASPPVARLMARLRAHQDELVEPLESIEPGYPALKARLDGISFVPRRWAEAASDADLDAAAQDLMVETDEARLGKYLSIFCSRAFPGPPQCLIDLTGAGDRSVARRAWQALAGVRAPEVRALALQLIVDGQHPGQGVRLLASNYRPGDLALIQARLTTASDDDLRHGIETSLDTLVGDGTVPAAEAVESLMFLYENGPCSLCRAGIVGRLAEIDRVPAWMHREVAFDANPDAASCLYAKAEGR